MSNKDITSLQSVIRDHVTEYGDVVSIGKDEAEGGGKGGGDSDAENL